MQFKTMTALVAMAMLSACNSGTADKAAADGGDAGAPAATAATTAAATPITLQPLTEADNQQFTLGCTCGLDNEQGYFLQTGVNQDPEGGDNITTRVAMRINDALVTCVIDKEQSAGISGGEAAFQCGDYQVALTRKGPKTDDADDAGQPATLTVTRGEQSATVEGNVDCAC